MRFGATPISKVLLEINASVKRQGAVIEDVNVLRLIVSRCVNEADVAGLQEVVRDHEMLLVGRDFEVVRSDDGLVLVRVIETLGVVYV